ncbi:ATP-binding cassette sub-family G member 1 [Araneus ventricosus]|uniref:ATP-binding cassette sub-family G member 1 n=1 Tax=Araneus ventricosus TaxID=182803 RepID=A0A4Y2LHG3_ARAVE|nr:ATP-binding cassette sub-family G member 1 [Araneus ventricosus]
MATQLRFFAHVGVGLLLGMLYYGIGNDANMIFNNSGFLFFSLIFFIFTAMMPTVLTFPIEKPIFTREYINSWYSTRMYYLAKTVSEIPFQILFPVIYCSIVYWMTAQPNDLVRFGLFILSSIMISLVAQSVGFLIGAATSVQNAVFLAPVVSIPILLFSGFFIRLDTIPHYLQWLSYISYVRYCYQSVLRGIYALGRPELYCDKICPFQEPQDFLREMDMADGNLYVDYAAMWMFFFVFRSQGGGDVSMGIDFKLTKREGKALFRVREQENTWTRVHYSSEIANNRMDSSEESSDIQDISDQPGPSSTYYPEVA